AMPRGPAEIASAFSPSRKHIPAEKPGGGLCQRVEQRQADGCPFTHHGDIPERDAGAADVRRCCRSEPIGERRSTSAVSSGASKKRRNTTTPVARNSATSWSSNAVGRGWRGSDDELMGKVSPIADEPVPAHGPHLARLG